MAWRQPNELDVAIRAHLAHFNTEPRLISIRENYLHTFANYFSGKVVQLCCGKGALYMGIENLAIPCIITTSPFCEDFLIGY